MNQLNSLILEGNVKDNAEMHSGIATFTIGVKRYFKNSKDELVEEISYFDIEAYGKMGEIVLEKTVKGMKLRIVGRLKQKRWEENGKAQSKIYVVAEHIEYFKNENKKESKND